jgi:hypothetical protein
MKVDEGEWFRVPAEFCGQALLAQEHFHPVMVRSDGLTPGLALLSSLMAALFQLVNWTAYRFSFQALRHIWMLYSTIKVNTVPLNLNSQSYNNGRSAT